MGEAIAFYFISACILGFAVLVISTKDTVHSVLFLVVDFLFVAALYVLLGAPFLAAIQILMTIANAHPYKDIGKRFEIVPISVALALQHLDRHELHSASAVARITLRHSLAGRG